MTKSKKTTLKLLICVLALIALAMTLVACNIGYAPDHYDYLVTFEYNVGEGDNALKCNMSTQRLGILGENSLISIQPGYDTTKFGEGIVSGYYLEGWYLPKEVDENGNPTKDENGFVLLGTKWNFKTMRVSEDITLYGNFVKKLAVRFINRATGEYIEDTIDYRPNETVRKPTSQAPTLKDHTFLGEYYDANGKEYKWDFQITEDVDVYIDFIEGIWSLVSTEEEFKTAIGAKRNIYLREDLNFKDKTAWGYSSEYTGSINGNGHTISNVNQRIRLGKIDAETSYGGLFGALGATANIYNINFVNVTVSVEVSSSYQPLDLYAGVLTGTIADGANLEKVSVSGTITYKLAANKTLHLGNVNGDNGVYGVIGKNNGKDNIKDCNFSEVTVA